MMFRKMISAVALTVLAVGVAHAHENANCTTEPKEKWQPMKQVKADLIKQGYQIRKIKVAGTCYEVYGRNAKNEKAEYFFNPVTAQLVSVEQ